jgi:hypothetical protein
MGGVMKPLNPQNSTTIEESSTTNAAGKGLGINLEAKINDKPLHAQPAPPQRAILGTQITIEQVTKYLHGVAADSIDEIDTLMKDLRSLQENLAAHRLRVEQGTVQFLEMNRSVLKLTDVITEGVAQVKVDRPV